MIPTLLLVLACVHLVVLEEQYVIPENINIDEILQNERLMKNYISCVLGKGKCTPDGERLKKTIPEALQNECKKCNESIKTNVRKVFHELINKYPESWKELEAKFDPEGTYKKKYKDLIEQEGLKI